MRAIVQRTKLLNTRWNAVELCVVILSYVELCGVMWRFVEVW